MNPRVFLITKRQFFIRSLFVLFSIALITGCTQEIEAVDYTKLPDYGSSQVALYVEKCGGCHAAPTPSIYPKARWPAIVGRMQLRMTAKKVVPLNKQQEEQILGYLEKYAQQ